jgi:glyoxylase-like metal-dependent hydrolase (beta-lactamase superfamily II)
MDEIVPGAEVLPGVHLLRLPLTGSPLRHTNGYLIRADDGWTLVDCGWDMPDVLEALRSQMTDLGARLEDIRTLVITHFHADHYGMAGTLIGLTQARMLMHRLDWVHIQQEMVDFGTTVERINAWLKLNGAPDEMTTAERDRAMNSFRRYTVVEPDVKVEDGHEIVVREHTLKVVWTPGHTNGHICLYDAERRTLMTGDHRAGRERLPFWDQRPSLHDRALADAAAGQDGGVALHQDRVAEDGAVDDRVVLDHDLRADLRRVGRVHVDRDRLPEPRVVAHGDPVLVAS